MMSCSVLFWAGNSIEAFRKKGTDHWWPFFSGLTRRKGGGVRQLSGYLLSTIHKHQTWKITQLHDCSLFHVISLAYVLAPWQCLLTSSCQRNFNSSILTSLASGCQETTSKARPQCLGHGTFVEHIKTVLYRIISIVCVLVLLRCKETAQPRWWAAVLFGNSIEAFRKKGTDHWWPFFSALRDGNEEEYASWVVIFYLPYTNIKLEKSHNYTTAVSSMSSH